MSQRSQLIDSLRVELDSAREEKIQTEQHYNDKSNELEALRQEYEEVRKSCEVIYFLNVLLKYCFQNVLKFCGDRYIQYHFLHKLPAYQF